MPKDAIPDIAEINNRSEARRRALLRAKEELGTAGIHADMTSQDSTPHKPGAHGLLGTHKGEPFCVYCVFHMVDKAGAAWWMEVRTRWKGKDHVGKRPVDVLKT